jgi:hypothetical protein
MFQAIATDLAPNRSPNRTAYWSAALQGQAPFDWGSDMQASIREAEQQAARKRVSPA